MAEIERPLRDWFGLDDSSSCLKHVLQTTTNWQGRQGARGVPCVGEVMRRLTFSRNYTISLSRTCQCCCKYCSFATHRAHLYSPDEVERMLDDALRRNAKELLVLTGENPEVNAEVAARLESYGHSSFTDYVAWTCE